MCMCTPEIRTPYCGRPGCEWPAQEKSEIKRIDIKEFRERGYLQELNRQFLHPLGMALEVIIDSETGQERLGGIWDYRDEPEGMVFADGEIDPVKAAYVAGVWSEKRSERINRLGYVIQQPITDQRNGTKATT